MKKEIKENQEEELEPYGEWEYRFSKIIEKGIDWKSQSIVHSGWIEELEKRIQKERQEFADELIKKLWKLECPFKKNHPKYCHYGQALSDAIEIIKKAKEGIRD